MDWTTIISHHRQGRHRRRDGRATRSPRSASTSTSATPACSTSARPAFLARRRATAWRSPSPSSACRSGSASSVGLAAAVLLALLLGIPTLRLRADYLAIVTIAAAEIVRLIFRSVRVQGRLRRLRRPAAASPTASTRSTPSRTATYGIGWFTFNERRAVGAASSAGSSSRLSCAHRLPAHAQPVGPGAQGHPRGRGRRAQPRQERLLLQDAVADPRRRHRLPRRLRLRPRPRLGAARHLRHRDHLLRLHRS